MGSVSRTSQFAKVHKVLKRHYKPVRPDRERPVLEHLLFACCLEDAHYEAAEETFAALVHIFFDWNEIRVTSIAELSETLARLPDPRAAAYRLKRVLQSVFESTYAFDLEDRRKTNLGPTIKWLKKLDGVTDFAVAYVVQSALGGHALPVDRGALQALRIVELVSDEDLQAGVVPGLERAISKAKGIEFGSLLHQLGADFTANPYSPAVRKILLEINPQCKDRLPKRRAGKKAAAQRAAEAGGQAEPGGAKPSAAKDGTKAAESAKSEKGARPEAKRAGPKGASAAQARSPTAGRKKPGAAKKKPTPAKDTSSPADASSAADAKKKAPPSAISKRKPR